MSFHLIDKKEEANYILLKLYSHLKRVAPKMDAR